MAHAQRTPPAVVAFDVVGTLFSLDPLAARMRDVGLPERRLTEWFARFLRDAFALEIAGGYVPFRQVAGGALEVMLAEHGLPASSASIVLGGFSELPPHPDVRPAFEQLRGAGVRVVALTNGSAETTQRLLEQAALSALVDRIISIDEVRRWKPHREVYLHAAHVLGVAPTALALVAAHAWDVLGADRAGLTTGWVSRKETAFQPAMGEPTVQGCTLTQVVEALLALKT
jgi:2-haloacid dehalogenase